MHIAELSTPVVEVAIKIINASLTQNQCSQCVTPHLTHVGIPRDATELNRLVVLESRLGLESGLESIFAVLGLELELKGLGLGLGLGSFFLQVLCQVHCNLTTNSRNNVRRSEKHELKPWTRTWT